MFHHQNIKYPDPIKLKNNTRLSDEVLAITGNLKVSDRLKFYELYQSGGYLDVTGEVFASGNITALNELRVGNTNKTVTDFDGGDSWGRIQQISPTTNDTGKFYGFMSDDSSGRNQLIITNEELSWNQAIVLGDTYDTGTGTLFGISLLELPTTDKPRMSRPTDGTEDWKEKLRVLETVG